MVASTDAGISNFSIIQETNVVVNTGKTNPKHLNLFLMIVSGDLLQRDGEPYNNLFKLTFLFSRYSRVTRELRNPEIPAERLLTIHFLCLPKEN